MKQKQQKQRDRTPVSRKAMRIIKAQSFVYASQVSRYVEVVEQIADATSLSAARTLAETAKNGMTPGTLAWAKTSRVLATPSVRGFCPHCGISLFGCPARPQPACPLENVGEDCHVA